MTFELELTPEQQRRLQSDAQAAGLSPTEYALRRLFTDDEELGLLTAVASEDALRSIWDTPEEDEAWQHLQPGTS